MKHLYIGAFFIVLGFLLKAFPDLIAGYNTMTREQKEKIDIKGLSTNMRNTFIIMGLVIILGAYLLSKFEFYKTAEYVMHAAVLGGVIYIFATVKKYDLRKK